MRVNSKALPSLLGRDSPTEIRRSARVVVRASVAGAEVLASGASRLVLGPAALLLLDLVAGVGISSVGTVGSMTTAIHSGISSRTLPPAATYSLNASLPAGRSALARLNSVLNRTLSKLLITSFTRAGARASRLLSNRSNSTWRLSLEAGKL